MDRRLKLLQRHSRPITDAGGIIPHVMSVKILRKKRKTLRDREREVKELAREFPGKGEASPSRDLSYPSL